MPVRVLLANAVDIPSSVSCVMPDNGLALLAACLRSAGHEVEIWDPGTVTSLRDCLTSEHRQRLSELLSKRRESMLGSEEGLELVALDNVRQLGLRQIYDRFEEQLLDAMRRNAFDVLGLKLWFGPGLELGLGLAERVCKKYPKLHAYAGGPMATLAPELILRKAPTLRGVCLGDGEAAILAIADGAAHGRTPHGVPNLWLRSADFSSVIRSFPSDLDRLPTPCYAEDVYPAMSGDDKLPIFYIEDSRGCPRNCAFCGHSLFTGPGRRLRSVSRVVDEMDALHRHFGAYAFRLTGSSTSEAQYRSIAERLLERQRRYLYSGFGHIENWSPNGLGLLRRSGLSGLFVGVESGSDDILKLMGKHLDRQRLTERTRECLDLGIFICGSVIFPAPEESTETEEATFSLLCELFEGRSCCAVPLQPAFPQPGSKWGDNMTHYGFSGDRQSIVEDMAHRRISRLLPQHVTAPLPYRLDGMTFEQLVARSQQFAQRLQAHGILTGISDELVLVALASGRSPREFVTENHEIFSLADSDRLTDLVRLVRSGAQAPQEALS